jgi:inosose dehydratase
MTIVAASPTTWGVDYAGAPDNPRWPVVLDGIAAAGYRALELGPVGYLPEDGPVLRAELSKRGLRAAGSFVFEPFHDPAQRAHVLEIATRACRLVAAAGGAYLVVIDHVSADRAATAGVSAKARRLSPSRFALLAATVDEVAEIAAAHGLRAVFHHHAATYVEFGDELARLLDVIAADLLGVCLDTGHCLYAGGDPLAALEELGSRVECIHLKDVDPDVHARAVRDRLHFDDAVAAGIFCRLGEGLLELSALAALLDRTRFDGYLTVEQDRDPVRGTDAVADARASLAALRSAGITDDERRPVS